MGTTDDRSRLQVALYWPSRFGRKKANECKSLAKMAARVGIEPTTK